MEKYLEIIEVHGREILDSRGNPTVAAVVTVTVSYTHLTLPTICSV